MLLALVSSSLATAAGLDTPGRLRVDLEKLADPILVNGVPLTVSRATGIDVGLFVERMTREWTAEGGPQSVRSEVHGAWTILSRIHDAGLEVLQWRGSGTDAELLWSRSELRNRHQDPMRETLQFPSGCVAGRTVSGRVEARFYSQRLARCKGTPKAALAAAAASARSQGFAVQARDGQLLLQNRTGEVAVLASPSGAIGPTSDTTLIYLQVTHAERQP